jgi:hypothetical protein
MCWISQGFMRNCAFPTGITVFPGGLEIIYGDFEDKANACIDAYCAAGIPFGKLGKVLHSKKIYDKPMTVTVSSSSSFIILCDN